MKASFSRINHAYNRNHLLRHHVFYQQLGFAMVFDYVVKRRFRRLAHCHSLGNIPNYWAMLKISNIFNVKLEDLQKY